MRNILTKSLWGLLLVLALGWNGNVRAEEPAPHLQRNNIEVDETERGALSNEAVSAVARALYDQGAAKLAEKKYKEAKEFLNGALQIQRDFIMAHNALGLCHEGMGDPKTAIEEFRTAVNLSDKLQLKEKKFVPVCQPHFNLGRLLLLTSLDPDTSKLLPVNHLKEAITTLEKALAIKPAESKIHFYLAWAFEKNNETNSAEDEYLIAITIRERPATDGTDQIFREARLALSMLYAKGKRYELAYKYIEPIKFKVSQDYVKALKIYLEEPPSPPRPQVEEDASPDQKEQNESKD